MNQTKRFSLICMFAVIEIVLASVPFLGFIPLGFINLTTLHLPVILAGILLGPKEGALLGAVFGTISLFNATFNPNLTSFIFSPFIEINGIHSNGWSLVLAYVPRILLGISSGYFYRLLLRYFGKALSASLAAMASSLVHTGLVLGGIALLFAHQYRIALGLSAQALPLALLSLLSVNGLCESALAAVIAPSVVKAIRGRKELAHA